jgi:hypothetical protein
MRSRDTGDRELTTESLNGGGGAPGKVPTSAKLGGRGTTINVFRVESAKAARELAGMFGPRDGNGVAEGAAPAVEQAAGSSGSALPAGLRDRFEASLGADLSGVRVHTGSESASAAEAVGARAYTIGSDIHFGAGQYAPGSTDGDILIAHEVAHTVQQQGRPAAPQYKLAVSTAGDAAEVEADRAASAMVAGQSASVSSAGVTIARSQAIENPKGWDNPPTTMGGAGQPTKDIKGALGFLAGQLAKLGDETQIRAAMSAWYDVAPVILDQLWNHPGMGMQVRLRFSSPSSSQNQAKDSVFKPGKHFESISYDMTTANGVGVASIDAGPSGGWTDQILSMWVPPVRPKAAEQKKIDKLVPCTPEQFHTLVAALEAGSSDDKLVELLHGLIIADVVPNPPFSELNAQVQIGTAAAVVPVSAVNAETDRLHGVLHKRGLARWHGLSKRLAVIKERFADADASTYTNYVLRDDAINVHPATLSTVSQRVADVKSLLEVLDLTSAFATMDEADMLLDLALDELSHHDTGDVPLKGGVLQVQDFGSK